MVLLEFRVIYALYHDWYLPAMDLNPFAYTYLKFAHKSPSSALRKRRVDEFALPGPASAFHCCFDTCLFDEYKVSQQR